jgi:hypothetical protein
MRMRPPSSALARRVLAMVACACSLALPAPAALGAGIGEHGKQGAAQLDSATLEQCVTSVVQGERSATFAAEMTAIPGAPRMAVRIEVQERLPGETLFHRVNAPGLGAWRAADPRVKIYKYLKQVTNLSAPAEYRALVRFRWETAGGRVVKRAERLTQRCTQPEAPPSGSSTALAGTGSTAPPTAP